PPFATPSVRLLCTDGNLFNVTDPNPLISGFAAGNNGTAVFGCGLQPGGVTPALTVTKPGSVTATFSLPAGVGIYLVPNQSTLGQLSQTQCAAGILLTTSAAINVPVGSYSYCESFSDPALLTPVTVSWFQ